MGASRESGEIDISIFLYIDLFCSESPTIHRSSHAVAQKTWNHLRMCLLGVRTLKLISTFYIIAKTVEVLAKMGLSFFGLNA